MSGTIDPFSPEQLKSLTPEQVTKLLKTQAKSSPKSPRKLKRGIEFYRLEKALSDALKPVEHASVWRLVLAILQAHFDGFEKNPVKLTSALLAEFRISRYQKLRGLRILERTGLFCVERASGRNPLVTMKWKPIKK
jgi:hypothetical protein